jgi:hypothetical protein
VNEASEALQNELSAIDERHAQSLSDLRAKNPHEITSETIGANLLQIQNELQHESQRLQHIGARLNNLHLHIGRLLAESRATQNRRESKS